ncbi:segregation and condensation protein B [Nonomuraea africana]|uniref:Segregation and condensation protein B n=2 Tax=Nonomuraea africana TaxID=46171 RepID=A0ABR9KGZ4_9ACTN|nr:segregation and condensation protein B [Nonomuraea africana]
MPEDPEGVSAAGVSVPGVTVPGVTVRDVTVPGVTVPDVSLPGVSDPGESDLEIPVSGRAATPFDGTPSLSGDGHGAGSAVLGGFSWDGKGAAAGRPEEMAGSDVAPSDDAVQTEQGPELRAALEAILIVVDEPVAAMTLAQVLERPTHEIETALRALSAEYSDAGRGFDLREVAGGWRFYTRADCAQLVERFVRDGQQARLTQAALETLAVVAYRQPVSRARVAAVRGVNSDGVMRTLVARGLVEEAGTDPESQAVLYRTSSYFLERLGLKSIDELPELAPFLPDDVENLEETTK